MKEPWDEDKLTRWFRELRAEDERGAPVFDQVVRARPSTHDLMRPGCRWWPALRFAAVLGLIVWVAFHFWAQGPQDSKPRTPWAGELIPAEPPSSLVPWQTAVLMAEWRSPTDFLLSTPDGWSWEAGQTPGDVSQPTQARWPANQE